MIETFIHILKGDTLTACVFREELDHYFLLEDGVKVSKEWIDNDGIHFSTRKKAEFARSK